MQKEVVRATSWGIATTALFLIGGLIFMLPVQETRRSE